MGAVDHRRVEAVDGLVVESPRGVPILIGRHAYKDPVLRQVSGTDLWFQVREGRGSRVLLRTSMVRQLARSPRECMEMAADLASYFSDSRPSQDDVGVMWTDSRHVAKRGSALPTTRQSASRYTIFP